MPRPGEHGGGAGNVIYFIRFQRKGVLNEGEDSGSCRSRGGLGIGRFAREGDDGPAASRVRRGACVPRGAGRARGVEQVRLRQHPPRVEARRMGLLLQRRPAAHRHRLGQGRASLQALREGGRVRLRGAQERQRRCGRERHGLHRGAEGRHLGVRGEVQGRPHGPRRHGPRRRAPPLPHDPQDGQGHVPRVLLERELRARIRQDGQARLGTEDPCEAHL